MIALPGRTGRVLLALGGPALLAAHTLAYSAGVEFAGLEAWRRLWSDLAIATASWVDAAYGPAPQRVVARGDEAEDRARRLILERIERDGLRATRPLATIRDRPFVRERIAPEPKPYDDKGRSALLAVAFRLRGGIAPFLILWLGWLAAAPVLAWTAVELCAAGHARTAAAFMVLLGLTPFVAETLALPRNAVGFYLVGLLLVIPLAVYGRLGPAPTLLGLSVRTAATSLALALCVFCRSSVILLVPGIVLAFWLGARRAVRSPWRRWAATAAAAALFILPSLVVRQVGHHDVWQAIWEGLGDFDRDKGHAWSDPVAEQAARRAGAPAMWTPESESAFRAQVIGDVVGDPAWFARILIRRLAATVTLWKLWPWAPMDGVSLRPSTAANEGLMDKYWRYTTPIDHLGFGPAQVEIPVVVLLAPGIALAIMAARGRGRTRARDLLLVSACPALASLGAPVLISTAAGQETQAFGLTYLLTAAFLVDLVSRRGER
jgi:hypothetical protein